MVAVRPGWGNGPGGAAAKVSHDRPVRMFERRAVAVAAVMASLIGVIASDGGRHTIRKDYPSGAAAKVSHNRPVRMLSNPPDGRSRYEGWRVGSLVAGMTRSAGEGCIRRPRGAAGSPHNRFRGRGPHRLSLRRHLATKPGTSPTRRRTTSRVLWPRVRVAWSGRR